MEAATMDWVACIEARDVVQLELKEPGLFISLRFSVSMDALMISCLMLNVDCAQKNDYAGRTLFCCPA